ncbi:MAG: hypothetical protein GAK45_00859 [Pseudomonas citronellolis]|nr:MAG: hypothetical protein GAK45_00859 [Pseudomonas citronellolis]
MRLLKCFLLAIVTLWMAAGAQAGEAPCETPAACNAQGSKAYQAKRYSQAIKAFELQLRYAERYADDAEPDRSEVELALNNLMLTQLRMGRPGMARAWMWVALHSGLGGEKTLFNAGEIEKAYGTSVTTGWEGHYVSYGGAAQWNQLDIRRDTTGFQADFAVMRIGNLNVFDGWAPHVVGGLSVSLVTDGPIAQVPAEQLRDLGSDCRIVLIQERADIQVTERFADGCQDYGGAGVTVAGTWYKVEAPPR